jgi:hypothetical protein
LTRPGRELLFTVVSQDEKYKAKVKDEYFCSLLGLDDQYEIEGIE